jgi:hypothetical protein
LRLIAFAGLALLGSACSTFPHRKGPEAFRTPQATFETWVSATRAKDQAKLQECYWPDMPKEELQSWMRENLRPEVAGYFEGAKFVRAQKVSPVELNFYFKAKDGAEEGSGVMVLTRDGWKIQRW